MVMATSNNTLHNNSGAAPPSTPYLYHYYPEEADADGPEATAAVAITSFGIPVEDDAISAIGDDASISSPVNDGVINGDSRDTTISRILVELRSSDSLYQNISSECKSLNSALDGYRSILLDEMEAAFSALNSHQETSVLNIANLDSPEIAIDKNSQETMPITERFTPRLMTMSAILSRLR
jgi:hypothetical protein